jgi:hypothetical protein
MKTMKKHIWNHVVTKKVLNKSKYILDFRFFKVANISLEDSFAHSWHSLNSLEGVPTYAEHLLAAFPSLCSPTHPTMQTNSSDHHTTMMSYHRTQGGS